jgi:transcriptional regulator GlxA family with amidase domain
VCNIIAGVLDKNSSVQRVSLTAAPDETYSPLFWPLVRIEPKPLMEKSAFVWMLCFLFGGICGAFGLSLARRRDARNAVPLARLERSEKNQALLAQVRKFIDAHVTDSALSVRDAAHHAGVSTSRINALLHRNTGDSFLLFLMRARVEIAKERLRSSHSSETAIAGSCGFTDIVQMEKYFKRLCRTSPVKFRQEHQIN